MTTQAIKTQGTKLEIQDNTSSPIAYVQVKEMVSFNAFDGQASEIDCTSLDSTSKEFLMGLMDNGQFSGEFNFLPSDAGQQQVREARAATARRHFKLTLSDASVFSFDAFVQQAPISGGVDAKMDASFVLRITGDVDFDEAP